MTDPEKPQENVVELGRARRRRETLALLDRMKAARDLRENLRNLVGAAIDEGGDDGMTNYQIGCVMLEVAGDVLRFEDWDPQVQKMLKLLDQALADWNGETDDHHWPVRCGIRENHVR